jgi:hypothetical protein
VLSIYNYEIDEETQKEVESAMTNWSELLDFADRKDFDVNDFKKNFAEVTKQEVETFKGKIKDEYDLYMSKGPGVSSISLDDGLELL